MKAKVGKKKTEPGAGIGREGYLQGGEGSKITSAHSVVIPDPGLSGSTCIPGGQLGGVFHLECRLRLPGGTHIFPRDPSPVLSSSSK